MRTKLTRAVILMGALLGLLATSIPSAQATTIASATFTGTATVPGGLGYPCTPIPPDPLDCAGQLTVPKTGNSRAFDFASTTCVGVKQDIGKKGGGTYGPNCVITATGTLVGYCGLSLGEGLGTVTWFPPNKTVEFTFKYVGVGGTLVVTGTTKNPAKGEITAVVEAVPDPLDPAGGSCLSKSATRFIIAGEAAIANPTV